MDQCYDYSLLMLLILHYFMRKKIIESSRLNIYFLLLQIHKKLRVTFFERRNKRFFFLPMNKTQRVFYFAQFEKLLSIVEKTIDSIQ